jgi:choline-sulfatase
VFVDNLVPRWGDGTEFRVVRDGPYKYVRFRDLPDLCFDVDADPAEHDDLVRNSGEQSAAVERLASIAASSLDFEAAAERREADERDRADRELTLDNETTSAFPNLYHLPDGRIVDAETPLYDPTVVIEEPSETFGDWPTDR